MQFAAAIAANGDQTNIVVPFKSAPGIAENNISKTGSLIDQAVHIFTLVEAPRKMALSRI